MAEVQGDAQRGEEQVAGTLAYLGRSLVEHVDDVRVERSESERGPVFRLRVHPDDVGRVIGRAGRIARAIRQVTRVAAARADMHVVVEIGGGEEPTGSE